MGDRETTEGVDRNRKRQRDYYGVEGYRENDE